ncbi:HAD family hydrolase [Caballeronia sp. LZ019]|uniref:HAD family hydrolase n=1 Tax=Caballeronia sp. LZ019 TaxID=3038555 RepID=UPI00285A5695|nr:HAD family hydrolase [Caballeronia sp. LZ019]MDR5809288.1 HAD family hydrolase [Caballeronia sp. LZ019]
MAIKAVVFDAFGTLCEITAPKRPYARLARLSKDRQHARQLLMSKPFLLREAAVELGVNIDEIRMLEAELQTELASIRLFPEVSQVLMALRSKGVALAVASNLALPYAAPLRRLLPFELDAYAWSFEVGSLKPDCGIYSNLCSQLRLHTNEVLMIGDTYVDDYEGAIASGLNAIHLNRRSNVRSIGSIDSLTPIVGLFAHGYPDASAFRLGAGTLSE